MRVGPDNIITGEGVELELPSATVLSRIVSGVIDYGLLILTYVIFLFNIAPVINNVLRLNAAQGRSLLIFTTAIFFWVLPALITGIFHGRTLGKLATRTRVVQLDGGTITMNQAFIRSTVGIFEVFVTLGVVATVVAFVSQRGRRLGDMLGGTYVTRWPSRPTWEPKVSMPEELAAWASIAQTRPIPGGLSLNIADFLKARKRLTDRARESQSRALAAACERYVSPPPPWGTPPEAFLEAMTLLRYDAETRRLATLDARRQRLNTRITDMPFGVDRVSSGDRAD
ncbi:RDD family protein [Trueperella pecoris]|uniref:RDD family protein n=1 Tax=Trueperella pecoris TaxID=2733571 RepID=A0A7M1QUI5_9ACTO|nr:RDD family protein [Trueperella pecoris]QOQ38329.1 RDD family protein [Trueperella pecoris]QOR45184.1 RDD family protein [Trueperella pecoris]QTG75090.1 RDD family protein [Trueperella pecoris]